MANSSFEGFWKDAVGDTLEMEEKIHVDDSMEHLDDGLSVTFSIEEDSVEGVGPIDKTALFTKEILQLRKFKDELTAKFKDLVSSMN